MFVTLTSTASDALKKTLIAEAEQRHLPSRSVPPVVTQCFFLCAYRITVTVFDNHTA